VVLNLEVRVVVLCPHETLQGAIWQLPSVAALDANHVVVVITTDIDFKPPAAIGKVQFIHEAEFLEGGQCPVDGVLADAGVARADFLQDFLSSRWLLTLKKHAQHFLTLRGNPYSQLSES